MYQHCTRCLAYEQQHPSVGGAEQRYLAYERHQVMLAHAEELNILDNHHLVVVLVEYRVIHHIWKQNV